MENSEKTKVLFICLGNICRSPMAACVFRHLATKAGVADKWHVDSAALGNWHVRGRGDPRMKSTLKKHNIDDTHTVISIYHVPITQHFFQVRQITQSDFRNFDLILGMDEENMNELEELAPADARATLKLFGEYDPDGELIIRDPYYDRGSQGFDKVTFSQYQSLTYRSPFCFRCMNSACVVLKDYLIQKTSFIFHNVYSINPNYYKFYFFLISLKIWENTLRWFGLFAFVSASQLLRASGTTGPARVSWKHWSVIYLFIYGWFLPLVSSFSALWRIWKNS